MKNSHAVSVVDRTRLPHQFVNLLAPRFLRLPIVAVAAFALSGGHSSAASAPEVIRLRQGDAPGALGKAPQDVPTLTRYSPAPGIATGTAIVVCPGGGYGGLAPHEGKG